MNTSNSVKVAAILYTSIRTILLEDTSLTLTSYLKSISKNIGNNLEPERILNSYFNIEILPNEYIIGVKINED